MAGGLVVGKGVCSLMPTGGEEGWRARVQSCALGMVGLRIHCPERMGFLCQTLLTSTKCFLGCRRQTSLVVQRLRIHLAVQGMQGQSLVGDVKISHPTEQLSP